MKIKLQRIEFLTMSLGVGGGILFAMGLGAVSASCIGLGTIHLGRLFDSNRPKIEDVLKFGGYATGSGLFAIGLGVSIAKYAGEKLSDPELEQEFKGFSEDEKRYLDLTKKCKGCKYVHGRCYGDKDIDLICAIHPSGVEENICPDWEQKHD